MRIRDGLTFSPSETLVPETAVQSSATGNYIDICMIFIYWHIFRMRDRAEILVPLKLLSRSLPSHVRHQVYNISNCNLIS
jgi:hypothetical protein